MKFHKISGNFLIILKKIIPNSSISPQEPGNGKSFPKLQIINHSKLKIAPIFLLIDQRGERWLHNYPKIRNTSQNLCSNFLE